ncbi:MAG: serine hydrolase [Flavobacteriales bacterium]|nr:serine hydrolase [Flavobacteriales bacterium]
MSNRTFVLVLVLVTTVSISITYVVTRSLNHLSDKNNSVRQGEVYASQSSGVICEVELTHEDDDKRIRPFLFAEDKCESDELADLKALLQDSVNAMHSSGKVTRAAVYFRDLNHAKWTSLNGTEMFYPASMLKVSIMMNVLKVAESDPRILYMKSKVDKNIDLGESVNPSQRLIPGKEYTVMELLEAMMKRSDNDATTLLFKFIDQNSYDKLFTNLNINVPEPQDFYYSINPIDFSKFYRLIYHASYLNRGASEYALKLMDGSEFKDGLQKKLPKGAEIIHKFGERNTKEGLSQFHDSGIVYLNGEAYLVIVMTEGPKAEQLKDVVSDLSAICYDYMRNMN